MSVAILAERHYFEGELARRDASVSPLGKAINAVTTGAQASARGVRFRRDHLAPEIDNAAATWREPDIISIAIRHASAPSPPPSARFSPARFDSTARVSCTRPVCTITSINHRAADEIGQLADQFGGRARSEFCLDTDETVGVLTITKLAGVP